MRSRKFPLMLFAALTGIGLFFSSAAEPDPALLTIAEAGAAIPQASGVQTERGFLLLNADWCRRRILTPLREVAKGQPWEVTGVKFVDDSIAMWNRHGMDKGGYEELAVRGEKLLQDGCDDPVVRYYAARAENVVHSDHKVALAEFRRSLAQLEKDHRYPRAVAFLVARRLEGTLDKMDRAVEQQLVNLTREAFEEGSFAGADDAIFVGFMMEPSPYLDRMTDEVEKMIRELKELPEWARRTILGKIEVTRAWKARGGGWASSVSEEGWRGFGRSLDKARAELVEAWKLRPEQPYAAKEMIAVTMGGDAVEGESLRLWFDRTVKARFDYMPAYDAFGWALRPRWGGSYEEMLAFGRACAATKRYDTEVPQYFRTMIESIASEQDDPAEYYGRPAVAADVMALHKQLIANPTSPINLRFRLSAFLIDAWLCHRFDGVRKALDQLPDHQIVPKLTGRMSSFGTSGPEVVAECLIFSGPAGDDYAKARESEKSGHYADAAGYFEAALKKCGPDSEATEFLHYFVKSTAVRVEFAKGQWIDISPKMADHSDWSISPAAQWSVPEDGTFKVTGSGASTLTHWHRPVGKNYELRASFEFLPMPDPPNPVVFAVELGYTRGSTGKSVVCQFYANKMPDATVQVLRGFFDAKNPTSQVKFAEKNDVDMQCWNGRMSLYFNGQAVFENFKTKWGSPGEPDGEIGFGGYEMSPKQTVRISKISVRKLSAEPSPPGVPSAK